MSEIVVVPLTRSRADIRRFLLVPYGIYRDDPLWVAPLMGDLRKVFTDENPFFQHAEMQLWVAVRDGRDVGRIAGIVDRNFNSYQKENAAFFGFFECVKDRAVSHALMESAMNWARTKGLKNILGPLNPTTNEEGGLLVDGFDSPPVFMMTYNPPYYSDLVTGEGFTKAKDLLAYFFNLANTPMGRFERIASKFRKREPDISITPIRKRNLAECLAKVKSVYNEAWQENWGFVPMTDAEVDFMAGRLKPLLTEGLAYVAETPREPVGFLLAMPDFNQAFKPLKGQLLTPRFFGFVPYLLGWKVPNVCRVITLGVKASHRGRGIEAAMLAEGLRTGFKLGFQGIEASWILEDNTAVQRVIELFGGKVYKTYRVYERPL
ncbi:MAG TPA: GNAT family N-acetyltransferase [Verrucomicrobiota bacterium]|nr:GNAT family N-acetyltransferase [Verrucomicrobiota bacterium]